MTPSAGAGAQLRKGAVEYCVLGLLRREPTYGWKISEQLVRTGLIGSIGTLYPLMSRLRSQGLIRVKANDDQAGSGRRYYTLTSKGRQQLEDFREQWLVFSRAVDEAINFDGPG